MRYAVQWIRSLVFIGQMYTALFVIGVGFLPLAIWDRKWAFRAVYTFCNYVRWSASWIVGLKSEIRGEVPDGELIIASKHQSFFDILMICSVVRRPRFIMKKVLKWAPVIGYYGLRIRCIPVDRGKRGAAIKQMVKDVRALEGKPGQLIVFPQGTRVAAGAEKPYKIGVGVIYKETGQTIVPAATNVGVFWPRHGIYRKPGLAVVEFLPPIDPGMKMSHMMQRLENDVETASNVLMEEAGFLREG